MDFLDPKKQRQHMIRLIVGYVLIGIAILIATIILLYQAYGFGIDRDGEVIHNGLVFVSSQPSGAQIYLNTKAEKDKTNTKLQIPGGAYKLELQRKGYHSWERNINVEGGSVEHYNYPLLFPSNPVTTGVKTYAQAPGLATQSPDRKWLIVQRPDGFLNFDQYDVSDPKRIQERIAPFELPAAVISSPDTDPHGWKVVEWSNNNRHVVLEHTFPGGSEYILVDRAEPETSINLTRQLALEPGILLSLKDKKHDKYFLYDPAGKTLASTSLDKDATRLQELNGLLAFKSYGSDKILYATEAGAAKGMVATKLQDGETTYKLREHPAGGPYLMDMVRYDRDWIVAVGSSADNKVYVYKNPQAVRKSAAQKVLVPVRVMKVPAPNYMAFSSNSQLLMVENGTSFATYDIKTDRGYSFVTTEPLEPPLTHAAWMDGHRIQYVSGGKLIVFDYDYINKRTLVPASAAYSPFFDRNYRYLYTLAPTEEAPAGARMTSTSLLTAEDL